MTIWGYLPFGSKMHRKSFKGELTPFYALVIKDLGILNQSFFIPFEAKLKEKDGNSNFQHSLTPAVQGPKSTFSATSSQSWKCDE